MRSWETFSRSIYRIVAGKYLRKIRANSLENVLGASLKMLDPQTIDEIRVFVRSQQTAAGGFADKGGRSDLYYSLFGFFVADALQMHEVIPSLKKYIKNVVQSDDLSGVHLNCAIILYAKLFGVEALSNTFKKGLKSGYLTEGIKNAPYTHFINLLTYYYTEDYLQLYKAQKGLKKSSAEAEMPCPVTAAYMVLRAGFGFQPGELTTRLLSFYRNDGSFSAVKRAPLGDLLSTGVALYAMKFAGQDIRIMKPDCLEYVDSLYAEGGFCATPLDPGPDVEYTFYGLLALGALAG